MEWARPTAREMGVPRWLRRSREALWRVGHLIPPRPTTCRRARIRKKRHKGLSWTNLNKPCCLYLDKHTFATTCQVPKWLTSGASGSFSSYLWFRFVVGRASRICLWTPRSAHPRPSHASCKQQSHGTPQPSSPGYTHQQWNPPWGGWT